MASFENVRWGSWAEVARESRVGRYLPLYLAGIAAGTGAAIGLTLTIGSDTETVAHVAPIVNAPAWEAPSAPEAPEAPAADDATMLPLSPGADLNYIELPANLLTPVVVAPASEPAPVAAPQQAPAAPAPAASLPQAAPAPAPAPAPPAKPNFYVPEAPGGGITDLEQRLLAGINAERAKAGLAPYAYDAGLSRVARTRSQQMVDQGYFGHVDPYGYAMYTELLAHFGYTSYAWAGENLALNNYDLSESPERAVISLMKSPTHAANILAGDFFRIGIGEVTSADGKHYYSMIFLG